MLLHEDDVLFRVKRNWTKIPGYVSERYRWKSTSAIDFCIHEVVFEKKYVVLLKSICRECKVARNGIMVCLNGYSWSLRTGTLFPFVLQSFNLSIRDWDASHLLSSLWHTFSARLVQSARLLYSRKTAVWYALLIDLGSNTKLRQVLLLQLAHFFLLKSLKMAYSGRSDRAAAQRELDSNRLHEPGRHQAVRRLLLRSADKWEITILHLKKASDFWRKREQKIKWDLGKGSQ